MFEEVERVQGREAAEVARKIMEWSRSNLPRFTFSKGLAFGVFIPVLDHQGRSYKPFWINTTKGVEFPFHSMHRMPPFDDEGKRVELVRRLNAIPGVQIPEEPRSTVVLACRLRRSRHRRLLPLFSPASNGSS